MQGLRILIYRRGWLALVLIALAIGMKAMVPAGYMLGEQSKTLTFQVCDGKGDSMVQQMTVPASGKQDGGKGGQGQHQGICPHSAVSYAAMTGADPIQLALALLFIFALGIAAVILVVRAHVLHLRPPLRGPPAYA